MDAPVAGYWRDGASNCGAVDMEITVGKIVGGVGSRRWAQVHDFVPEDDQEKMSKRGRLIVLASIGTEEEKNEVEVVSQGREILARLHELYYGNMEGEAMEVLTRGIENVEKEFAGVEVTALAIIDKALFCALNGGGLWARVGGKEGWVVNPNSKHEILNSKPMVLSSWAKDGQALVLGNSRFWDQVPLGIVKAGVDNEDMEGVVETLGAVVHGGGKGEGTVGAVVKIHDRKSETLNPKSEIILNTQIPKPKFTWPKINWPRIKLPRGSIYVAPGEKMAKQKQMMWAGLGFLIVLVLMVGGWQWRERNKRIEQSEQNKTIESVKYKFDEAKALVSLNPVRSRELLGEIEGEVTKWKSDKVTKRDERVKQIVEEWAGVRAEAMGIKSGEGKVVFDLGLLREGMVGEKLEMRDGKLEVLDTQGGRLIEVDPVKKSGEVVAGKEALGQAKLLATYPGKTLVFSDKGVVQCSMSNVLCSVAVKPDEEWGEVKDMGVFAGNIYLLTDKGVWRHQVTESGYGAKQKWLADTEDALGLGENMAIDGSIWVAKTLNSKSEILKYTRGVRESFTVSGLDKDLGDNRILYTDEDQENLYVLDRTNKRIVVLKKTGEYLQQYEGGEIGNATSLVVDEKAGKVYILAGSRIYEINK